MNKKNKSLFKYHSTKDTLYCLKNYYIHLFSCSATVKNKKSLSYDFQNLFVGQTKKKFPRVTETNNRTLSLYHTHTHNTGDVPYSPSDFPLILLTSNTLKTNL